MPASKWSDDVGQVARFLLVGMANTGLGYGIILVGLQGGLGDYAANILGFVLGLPISYLLHRSLTFRARTRRSLREASLYLCAFLTAFFANLAVVTAGLAIGYESSAVVQGAAIGSYAVVLFILTRFVVFRQR
ncbi:Putative flippase GtrA (transmembrane translocase of bactoprenol-linked glucose) [Novosphingobium panipatense]|uniref:Flippase GtrA (Transmembrane translocase of bactoprenol-linked glucose) n=1 Tax=Novosphingobium panipatense TaxID=428991 RepID=A0ABY1QI46_9SPHN|nr:Putative flippase GtrA (transmembrane translocase of bactoprenol-linked glucose) [Novosphingobium panipatense]